jgi:F0F1-type ATP synthase membrane subunit b/b'
MFYRNFSTNEMLLRFGVSLLIIVFICSTLTPFMINWYKTRESKVKNELKQLRKINE